MNGRVHGCVFGRVFGHVLGPLALLGLLAPQAQADWDFAPAVDVAAGKGLFHHLEASGRQALALSGDRVALVWEDDRSGNPRCYLAIKTDGQAPFKEQAFGQGECFAPGIAALDNGRFAVIWEDETGINTARVDAALGPALRLSDKGGQAALAWHPALGLQATWTRPEGRHQRLWLGRLEQADHGALRLSTPEPLEAQPPKDDQMYPALAACGPGFTLTWEDRRLGHTVIFSSTSPDGRTWSLPTRVSHNATGKAQGTDLGRGTGAMRPALACAGEKPVTVWLDKRDFLSGYDVYAALPGQKKNTKVQDSFGDAIAQWHPAAAGNARGDLVVAWDDDRDGTQDIWLSKQTVDGSFAENTAPPPAAGPNQQSDPVLVLDGMGTLHLAWVERSPEGESRLRYTTGRPVSQP
ncbi:MAG: hypothetical protein AB1421_00100 [Pseudomonadota bacterium]